MKVSSNIPSGLLSGFAVALRPYVRDIDEVKLVQALQSYEPEVTTAAAKQVADERYLSMAQVATRLGCGKALVRRHIRAGDLPAHKLGHRTVRVADSDLRAFEQQHLTSSSTSEKGGAQ